MAVGLPGDLEPMDFDFSELRRLRGMSPQQYQEYRSKILKDRLTTEIRTATNKLVGKTQEEIDFEEAMKIVNEIAPGTKEIR